MVTEVPSLPSTPSTPFIPSLPSTPSLIFAIVKVSYTFESLLIKLKVAVELVSNKDVVFDIIRFLELSIANPC